MDEFNNKEEDLTTNTEELNNEEPLTTAHEEFEKVEEAVNDTEVTKEELLEYKTEKTLESLASLEEKINITTPFAPTAPEQSFYKESIKPKKKKSSVLTKKLLASSLCFVLGGLALGFGAGTAIPVASHFVGKLANTNKIESASESQLLSLSATEENLSASSLNNINLIKSIKPAVVCITSTTQAQGFFNMTYEQEGSGSGIIFHKTSNEIFIATNYHVVQGASNVKISVGESDLVDAKLIGKDQISDLAVLSVSLEDLKKIGVTDVTVASFGDSDKMQTGSPVIAIGNALGEGNTATKGIISAVKKEINIQGRKLEVLQTDAAINPGNSGGALINSRGEVIGINTAKLSETSVEGVGYSITSNVAKPIIENLMNNTSAPFLGIRYEAITEEVASYYNLPQMGIMITEIIPGTSAAYSNLKVNDIITCFNNETIFSSEQLLSAIRSCKVGDVVEAKILRNGKEPMTIKVKLLANPDDNF